MPKPTPDQLNRMKEAATGRKSHHSPNWGGARDGQTGRPPIGTAVKSKPFSIRLSQDLLTQLEEKTLTTGKSKSQLIEEALRKHL
jgi:hypothetical protein